MKNKIMKVLGVVMTVAMLASFMVAGAPVSAAGKPASVNNFTGVTLPSADYAGTDVILMEVDGNTLYAAVTKGTDYWVVKSTDGGYNWDDTTLSQAWYANIIATSNPYLGAIVDIEASPSGNGVVYVAFGGDGVNAGSAKVYKIAGDGAGTISSLRDVVNEGGAKASALYDMDVYYDETAGINYVMVGSDVDALVNRDAGAFEEWIPLEAIDYDGPDDMLSAPGDNYAGLGVLKVAFAPDFATSSTIWALIDTGNDIGVYNYGGITNTIVLASTTGNGLWNTNYDAVLFDGNDVPYTVASGATVLDIAFPEDYSAKNPYLYLALDDTVNDGNVYLCVMSGSLGTSEADPLITTMPTSVCSVEVYGETIIAGESTTNNTWVSTNGGDLWTAVPVMGQTMMMVYMSDNFASDSTVWVATTGGNSGVSISKDGGLTYVQCGLIDFTLTTVEDMAFGVNGDEKAAILLTADAILNVSLWRTADVTAQTPQWGRVLVDDIAAGGNVAYNVNDVEVSLDGNVVMLYVESALSSGTYNIYKSTDGGFTFTNWRTLAAPVSIINDWIVEDGSSIYCATTGGFYGTSRFGPAVTKLTGTDLASVAMSGDAVIVGGTGAGTNPSSVFISLDGGNNWGAAYAITGSAASDTYVAFDADFGVADADGENLAYAATFDGVVYQIEITDDATDADKVFVGGGSATGVLNDSNSNPAGGASYDDIVVAEDNALYLSGLTVATASAFSAGGASIAKGGMVQVIGDTSDIVAEIPFAADTTISGVVGTFINGEVLQVIGDNLYASTATDILGTIQVQGATSGATGYVTLTTEGVGVATGLTVAETISVTSANLLCTMTGGAVAATTGPGIQRLLLHERANVWEGEANANYTDGLWYSNGSNLIWVVDSSNTVEVFEDFLSGKVMDVAASEKNPSPNTLTKTVKVDWTQLKGATMYEIEAWDASGATPALFSTTAYAVPATMSAEGTALTADVAGLAPLTKYNFYVRVAVDSANHSRWSSPAVSVTTGAYLPAPWPIAPLQDQSQTQTASLAPTFTWEAISTAVSYDFQLAGDASFSNIIDSANVPVCGYTYTGGELKYDTDYCWRVRAVASDGTKSVWSSFYGTGAPATFHTMMDPEVMDGDVTLTVTQTQTELTITQTNPTYTIPVPEFTVTAPAPPASTVTTITNVVEIPDSTTPAYIWAIVAIGALLTIAVIVLIIRTRRVV